ncbi:MAG: TetR/AcrR family transcriptional regulator [Lachnospiraceae bacterium]|nr:TetR/AcrR family transcriptional regulator [Lachnospiraceae bacterium]
MNTKENRRYKDTTERIVRAVYFFLLSEHKPLNRITVREICERAQINRSSFYAHFQDVPDVVEQVEKNMARGLTESFLQQLQQKSDMLTCFKALFEYIREYRQFYNIYLNQTRNVGAIGVAWDLLSDYLQKADYRKFGFESEEEMRYQGDFFLYGLTAMLRRWVSNGCTETPDELCDFLVHHYQMDMNLFRWDQPQQTDQTQ